MKTEQLQQLVDAVLYEGHILYPYRASARKNRQRFTFGRIYPDAYAAAQCGREPWALQTQCLFRPVDDSAEVKITVRFLQPLMRDIGTVHEPLTAWPPPREPQLEIVPVFELEGALFQSWQEATERGVEATVRPSQRCAAVLFSFPATQELEPIRDARGNVVAVIVRHQPAIKGVLEMSLEPVSAGLFRLTLRIVNRSIIPEVEMADADAVLLRTFASTHAVLRAHAAEFISLTDPPAEHARAAAECRNLGMWPVLVGDEATHECDTLLSSPIILSDYPQIAPQSAGNLFDGGEIDEILTLRILTMTDEEKREMRHTDELARRILERTEALPGDRLLQMHGVMRPTHPVAEEIFHNNSRLETTLVAGRPVRAGDRVRLQPHARADIMDIVLAGKIAVIEAVEQDAEGRVHLAVTVEDDPGRDLGLLRQPGHRFFYGVDEVELLDEEGES